MTEDEADEIIEVHEDDGISDKRQIQEIIPTDTMPEVNNTEPPELSLSGVLKVISKKGVVGAISDDAWGPHAHLVLLLTSIFIISICFVVFF